MRLKFCGAAGMVTGSAHLITLDNGKTILLDCGLFQGHGREIWDWNNHWYFNPAEIDYLCCHMRTSIIRGACRSR